LLSKLLNYEKKELEKNSQFIFLIKKLFRCLKFNDGELEIIAI